MSMDIPAFVVKDAKIKLSETVIRTVVSSPEKVNRYTGHNVSFDNDSDFQDTTGKNLIVVVTDYRGFEQANTYFVFPKEMGTKLDKHIKISKSGGSYWYDVKDIFGIAPVVYVAKSRFTSKMVINRLRCLEKFDFGTKQDVKIIS